MEAPVTKILYVEDNDDNIYMITRRLGRYGYEVIVAKDGEEGIAMVHSETPSLILMDLDLPVVDGWEATRRLKASDETRHIPIIAVSAYAMDSDRERALAAGCDDYFSKPVDLKGLLERIESLLPDGEVLRAK
jgi:CheY-like chemotaxis protein